MSRLKKLLCALVCICIMISCFPVGVFSYKKPGDGGTGGITPYVDPGVPDGYFITVSKTFEGITDKELIPSTFKISVGSHDLTTATAASSGLNDAKTGLIYTWRIDGVGPGTYKVSEVDADKIEKYDLKGTTGLEDAEVKAATLGDFKVNKDTKCSHRDWPVDLTGTSNILFAAALTSGSGCAVISKTPLDATQQLKIANEVVSLGGNWKEPVKFFNIKTNGYGPWTVDDKSLEYHTDDNKIWLSSTSDWSHVATIFYSAADAVKPVVNIVNTYEPNTMDIPVEKVWDDYDDAAGKRPESVTIKLLADGTEMGKSLTLRADTAPDKDWKDSFKDVPKKDASGKAIVYTVSEDTSDTSVFGSGEGKYALESITGTAETGFTVTNKYTPVTPPPPKPSTVTISGTKTLTGKTLAADDFTFSLSEQDGSEVSTVKNDKDGKFSFTFTPSSTPGTYTYEVAEKDEGKTGITYDVTKYVVSVTVDSYGKPDETTITKDGKDADSIVFTNTYAPTPTSVTLTGSKTLSGRTLKDDEFSFVLKELRDGTYADVETKKNDADGKFQFSAISLKKAGTYVFTVSEVIPSERDSHITYDTSVYTIKVDVKDVSGALTASVTREKGTEKADSIVFTNTYTPDAVNAQFSGEKKLEGKTLAAGDFSFTLSEDEKVIQTVTNAADGSFSFPAISYTTPGTHIYTVAEVDAKDSHIIYDPAVYTITVAVVKNEDGTLSKTETIKKGDDETVTAITFNNKYTPTPTSVTLQGTKKLEGKTLAAGDFSFTLTGDGGVNDSAKNDAEGKFTFKEINYTSEGKFEYSVKEVKGSETGITYDETEYTITVKVTDNSGSLEAVTTITKDGKAADSIVFTNTYRAPYIPPVHDDDPTVVTIKVRKTWDDSDNTYGLRPDTITVRLFADGVEKAHKTMTKDDGWKEISFTVAYKSGTKYEVKEDAVPGYLTTITGSEKTGGFDIVNKYDGGMGGTGGPGEDPEIPADEEPGRGGTDEKTEISVTKVWSDNNDRLRKRPSSITVKLYANGKDSGKELSLTSAAGWKGSFTELPVYDEDDALIVYTVKEVAVSGYTSKVTGDPENGFTITNTIKNTNVPKTGDNSRPALWTGLLLASALGFAAAAFGGKKTGRKKSR